MKILKLHGSLNWSRCPKCESVVPWYVGDYLNKVRFHSFNDNLHTRPLGISELLHEYTHSCGTKLEKHPVLVPPTWNKGEYHNAISSVWSQAASELSEAENIIVIGYSLPASDAFFRHLFALGSLGESVLRRFWVINPDESGDVEQRFREMLGLGAEQRFRLIKLGFETSFDFLNNEFYQEAQSR